MDSDATPRAIGSRTIHALPWPVIAGAWLITMAVTAILVLTNASDVVVGIALGVIATATGERLLSPLLSGRTGGGAIRGAAVERTKGAFAPGTSAEARVRPPLAETEVPDPDPETEVPYPNLMSALRASLEAVQAHKETREPLTNAQQAVVRRYIDGGDMSVDEIAEATDAAVKLLTSALTRLELEGGDASTTIDLLRVMLDEQEGWSHETFLREPASTEIARHKMRRRAKQT